MLKSLVIFKLFLCMAVSYSQSNYPVPTASPLRLFYIQHSHNQNTYVYEANLSGQKINSSEPITIFRIAYSDDGQKEDLTAMQRKMAYGIDFVKIKENHFQFSLAAFPEKKLFLRLDSKQQPYVVIVVNEREIILDRMFLTCGEKSLFGPKVSYIDFHGRDLHTGKAVNERMYTD